MRDLNVLYPDHCISFLLSIKHILWGEENRLTEAVQMRGSDDLEAY